MSKSKKRRYVRRVPKYKYERNVIKGLEARLKEYAPESGTDPAKSTPRDDRDFVGATLFNDLPISEATSKGLQEAGYIKMTDIQRSALPHSLVGRDVLGAAKTGSGKTLVFLITILEKLFRLQWTRDDGLGALIISPVRELALQIFEELRKVGKYHDFSGGLLIGGKDVDVEKSRIGAMNILIGTPGRLLHHLDETVGFDVSQMKILVLDEADRLLDMGFAKLLDGILAHLPKDRQSMLFSATQTRSVSDLVRLSLTDPEYLAVHAAAPTATPAKLKQFYVSCELHEKPTVLWSFIKTHSKCKIIVFASTCCQVRFLYEALKRLLSNQHVCCLHGRIKQNKRTETFYEFCEAKAMVLLATDVAARGLDFPEVDWVIQLDCAESVAEYIHRVGRTARYTSDGSALLCLMPQEVHMLPKLREKNIPIKEMKMKKTVATCPTGALQSLLSKTPKMKAECAKKAMVTYLRSFTMNPSNSIEGLQIEQYAHSLGMMTVPSSRAIKKLMKKLGHVNALSKRDRDGDLFVPSKDQDDTRPAVPSAQKPDDLPLKHLSDAWDTEMEETPQESDNRVDGVFAGPLERFDLLRRTIQQRTPSDRAFVKAWKKEASLKAKQNNSTQDQPAQAVLDVASDTSSDLIEIDSDDDLCTVKKVKIE